jgi:hypothetical protein
MYLANFFRCYIIVAVVSYVWSWFYGAPFQIGPRFSFFRVNYEDTAAVFVISVLIMAAIKTTVRRLKARGYDMRVGNTDIWPT